MQITVIIRKFNSFVARIYTRLISNEFYFFGESKIYPSVKIVGARAIKIGNNVTLLKNSWLYAVGNTLDNESPLIEISDNVYFGHELHLVAIKKIVIEKNVLIADKVYISDNIHNYEDITLPIKDQGIRFKNTVIIRENSWIGENVCIIGASVGRNSIISANAVVVHDIPDFAIAAGIPAVIIKRYDLITKKWRRTNEKGDFIIE